METFVFYSNSDFTAAQTFSLDFFNICSVFFFFFFSQILQERREKSQIPSCTRFRPKSAKFSQTGFFIFKTTPTL